MRKTKYGQLVSYLKEEFIYGKPPLSPLPSIPRLMASRNISQATVDRALTVLEQEGLIVKRAGVGCFVADPARDQQAQEATETVDLLSQEVARAGLVKPPPISIAVCSMPGESNPLWAEMAREVEAALGIKLHLQYREMANTDVTELLDAEYPVDIVYLSPSGLEWMADQDLLMDLQSLPRPWEGDLALGGLPAPVAQRVVPYSYVARVVLYDAAVMAGRDYDFANGWSWTDFRRVCEDLRADVPADAPILLLDEYRAFFTQWGIELIDPTAERVVFSGDRVRDALAYLKWLYTELRAFPLCSELNLAEIVRVLSGEHPALCIGRTPWKTRLEGMGTRPLGVWPVPMSEGGFQTMAINYLGLYKYCYFPEFAWDTVRFICSPAGQRVIDRTHQEFPLFSTGADEPQALELLRRLDPGADQTAAAAIHPAVLPAAIMDRLIQSVFNPEIEAYLLGRTSAETCMARITRVGTTMIRNAAAHRRRIGR